MAASKAVALPQPSNSGNSGTGALLLGTGLAFASIILLPAFAARFGVDAALTGAMRIALMRASSRVVSGKNGNGETAPVGFNCH